MSLMRGVVVAVSVVVAFSSGSFAAAQPVARSKAVGTWSLISEVVTQGGQRSEPLGHEPLGLMVLDQSGRFILMIARRDLPKFASNKRNAGTPEENKAVLSGSLAFFGTYSIDGDVLILRPMASTFPNWVGADQKRYFTVDGDKLTWTNRTPAVAGEVAELVWQRVATK